MAWPNKIITFVSCEQVSSKWIYINEKVKQEYIRNDEID